MIPKRIKTYLRAQQPLPPDHHIHAAILKLIDTETPNCKENESIGSYRTKPELLQTMDLNSVMNKGLLRS